MDYFKSAAKSVWNASKSIITDNRSIAQKLIQQIENSKEQVISTIKLNQLSALTYQIQKFQQITKILLKKIKIFKYQYQQARKTLNLLILINYLIKHGATAFVDQFRNYIGYFKQYQTLKQQKIYQDQIYQKKLDYQIQKIKSRSQYIQTLLEDKNKLLKQKQLSMLIKQKMKLYQKNKLSDLNKSYNNQHKIKQKQRYQQIVGKVDNILQKYLWKYVDKIDDKLQSISQKVLDKIDKYVLGELPAANFEIDNLQEQPQKDKENKPVGYQSLDDDDEFMKKLEQQSIPNANLLQFEEYADKKEPKNETLI